MRNVNEECIHEVFRRRAAESPASVALIDADRVFSYGQLDALSDALAVRLRDRDVRSGDIVGLLMTRSAEMVVAMLGILKCGAAYMPLDRGNPESRNRYCLEKARSRLIIADCDCEGLCSGERVTYRFYVQDLEAPCAASDSRFSTETPAYVMFTSGTTADPKGVVVPHRAVVRLVVDTNYVQITPHDAILQLSTPSFDAATFEIWGALLNGATLVLYTGEVLDPNLFRQHIARYEITILWLTAALFHLFVDKCLDALRPLRVLLAGGDVLHPHAVRTVLDAIDGIVLINGYGPTENTTFTCCHVMTRANRPEGGTVPIGRPITGTQIFILDEQRRAVAQGAMGELYAAGLGVALGYLNTDLAETPFFHDDRLSAGLLYRTGDLVRVNELGVIEFLGRKDSQIKLRGYRISLEEIKARLLEIPAVKEAAVMCEEGEDGDQLLTAYLRADEEDGLDAKTVRRHLSQRVPRYMIPDKISVGAHMPINKNGKIDRRKLSTTAA
jgi:amino acid adenylation domain-containing protein